MFCLKNKKNVKEIVSQLKDGKVMLAPSDTVLGLFAICSAETKLKIDDIKKRHKKPYLILASSMSQVEQFAVVPKVVKKLLYKFWPGPLTCVFRAQESLPAHMCSKGRTVAIRIPDQEEMLDILKEVGSLFSTSANLAKQNIPEVLAEIPKELLDKVDILAVDKNAVYPQSPSTIIDCTSGKVRIVREGVIPFGKLSED